MGDNYYSYGIKPDRKSLEALFRYLHQQGLCGRKLTIEEFVEPASMVLLTPRREKQMNRTAQKDPWALPEIMGRENLSAKGTGQIGSPTAQKKRWLQNIIHVIWDGSAAKT